MTTQPDKPKYSPGPWLRGLLYTLLGWGALLYGHLSNERPLTPFKFAVLGSVAVAAGVAAALLQTWARKARQDNPPEAEAMRDEH